VKIKLSQNHLTIKQTRMKKNMGSADKVIRVIIAIIFSVLYFTQIVTGTLATIILVLGGILLITSVISFCPVYIAFGINNCKKNNNDKS
jgi:hypothetical protein